MKFKPDPPSFRYTSSFDTDLRKTFARIRESQRQTVKAVPPANVASLVSRTAHAAATEHSQK